MVIGIAYEAATENWLDEAKDEGHKKRAALSEYLDVKVFSMDSVYSKEAIQWRNSLESLAIAINACYDAIFADISIVLSKENHNLDSALALPTLPKDEEYYFVGRMMPVKNIVDTHWHTKQEYDRRSSLGQARHFEIKLKQFGFDLTTKTSNDEKELMTELKNKILLHLELLAICEHHRWNDYMLLEKNVPYSRSKDSLYDQIRKTAGVHIDIDTFENISPKQRGNDYAFIYNIPEIIESSGLHIKKTS
jgi:hypothetical protein